jgi:hypothetical protein
MVRRWRIRRNRMCEFAALNCVKFRRTDLREIPPH